jgi:hypothetical protein
MVSYFKSRCYYFSDEGPTISICMYVCMLGIVEGASEKQKH